jgi:hypothetical protein
MRPVLLLVLLALLAGRAATASNAVPTGGAGAGSGIVSGYTVSDISYSVAGETIDGVTFSLAPPTATVVKARLAPSEPWTACTVSAGCAACPVATPLADVSALAVVATG